MTAGSRTIAAGIAAAAALALAACGDSDGTSPKTTTTGAGTVDTAVVESGIEDQLSTDDVEVSTVKCPSDVPSEAGTTFTCSVTWSNGAAGKVEVTESSLNRYTYEPVPGSVQVPGATVEQSLSKELAAQGAPDATVNCPDTIIVKVGTTVTCDVGGAGGQATGSVTFTFSSAEGTVDPSSVQTG